MTAAVNLYSVWELSGNQSLCHISHHRCEDVALFFNLIIYVLWTGWEISASHQPNACKKWKRLLDFRQKYWFAIEWLVNLNFYLWVAGRSSHFNSKVNPDCRWCSKVSYSLCKNAEKHFTDGTEAIKCLLNISNEMFFLFQNRTLFSTGSLYTL